MLPNVALAERSHGAAYEAAAAQPVHTGNRRWRERRQHDTERKHRDRCARQGGDAGCAGERLRNNQIPVLVAVALGSRPLELSAPVEDHSVRHAALRNISHAMRTICCV